MNDRSSDCSGKLKSLTQHYKEYDFCLLSQQGKRKRTIDSDGMTTDWFFYFRFTIHSHQQAIVDE